MYCIKNINIINNNISKYLLALKYGKMKGKKILFRKLKIKKLQFSGYNNIWK